MYWSRFRGIAYSSCRPCVMAGDMRGAKQVTCHGAFWHTGRRFNRNGGITLRRGARDRGGILPCRGQYLQARAFATAHSRNGRAIVFFNKSPDVARRLLTTLHASQFIDPFLLARIVPAWSAGTGKL